MPNGTYANIGFQMHKRIKLQKEAIEFVDWLNDFFGDFDGSKAQTREMYEMIQDTSFANDFYRGSRR